ncbi:MAG: MATE family efflux transporter [Acutalibacteraceae bacterium]
MDLKTARRILQVGAPMAIQQSIVSCGFLFLQRLVNYYGESMIASYTVASRMENILMIPIIGIQNTMATFAGQNMGAQRPDRVSKGLGQGVLVSLGMTLILCLAQIAGIPLIIRAFQLDAGAADICRLHLFSSAVAIPIFAVYFPANGIVPGRGRGLPRYRSTRAGAGAARGVSHTRRDKTSPVRLYGDLRSQAMSWTITPRRLLRAFLPRQVEGQIPDFLKEDSLCSTAFSR